MKVKLLNVLDCSKIKLVKTVKALTTGTLVEAKNFVDWWEKENMPVMILNTKLDKEAIVDFLDREGINYVFMDEKCPTHDQDAVDLLKQDNGLKDIVDTAKKIENAGVYLIPTEMGIQVVIVTHIPNEELLVSQLKGIFKDAHFDVGQKEIEDGKGMRLLFSKMFPNNAVSLDDINEFAKNAMHILNAYWVHRDFRELGKIVDNIVKEAFEKIEW